MTQNSYLPHMAHDLSAPDGVATPESYRAPHVFGNHASIRAMSMAAIEATLEQTKAEHAIRCRKVADLTEALGNFETVRILTNGGGHAIVTHAMKLEAETAQRDRLALAIQGLERAVAWRASNPERT